MAKKILTLVLAVAMTTAIYACGSGEGPTTDTPSAPVADNTPTGPATVEVPADVEGKWKAVKIAVTDRRDGSMKEYTIAFGEQFKVPDSEITIEPELFLPSFVMQGQTVTSASNMPDNPAAKVKFSDGSGFEASGWLFQRFPDTHKFPHENLDFVLIEGIPS
jgi:hypothetical protein